MNGFLFLLPLLVSAQEPQSVFDWAQPPAGCVEEIVPRTPRRRCLDYSHVINPKTDWPESASDRDIQYWQERKRDDLYCRALEILRREKAAPGTFAPVDIQVAWMRTESVRDHDAKVDAVYAASRTSNIPAQVLSGALFQESMYAPLGISEDGGNYSCGTGQVNLSEWCNWASQQTVDKRKAMNWPDISCTNVDASLVQPFYEIAKSRLNGLPEYRLALSHFDGIAFDDVAERLPVRPPITRETLFQATESFIRNCHHFADGIAAKANEIANLYRLYVPEGMKQREVYPSGKKFNRRCDQKSPATQYPLHSGWLMAVASYNAGPRVVDALAYYNRWNLTDVRDPGTFTHVTPVQLVESLYWAGHYNPADDQIHFLSLRGTALRWTWFKQCVVQRHVARIVSHVLLPGVPLPVDSLEGSYKCAKSIFDPVTGGLVQSGVPPHRRASTGVRP